MGLAASQARLLMLTSRKDDVEYKMMSIANQKLAMSRQSAQLSQDYNDALNATKLTWDTGNGNIDLTYGLFMSPSSSQYLLTNSYGAVILDNSYYSALGLSGNAGTLQYSNSGAASFLTAMGVPTTEDEAKKLAENASTSNASSGNTPFTTSYSDSDVFKYLEDNGSLITDAWNNKQVSYSQNYDVPCCFYANSSLNTQDLVAAEKNLQSLVNSVIGDSTNAVLSTLKANFGSNYSSIANELQNAAKTAGSDTVDFYKNQLKNRQNSNIDVSDGNQSTMNLVSGTNQIYNDSYGKNELYVDLNQVVKTFLDFFDAECGHLQGDDSLYKNYNTHELKSNEANKRKVSVSVGSGGHKNGTKKKEFSYTYSSRDTNINGYNAEKGDTVNNIDSNSSSASSKANAYYYYKLYTTICNQGWVKDDNVNNKDYLQNQIMNGNIVINQLQNNSWSQLSSSSPDSPLRTVNDEDAAKKAEADYDAKKDLLTSKEAQLDVTMNNLDTERSALVTETESVKKIIDKNVESSFKIFQA